MNRKILFAGVILYLLLIPFFYHSDIKEIYFKSQFLSQGVVDIYSHINLTKGAELFGPFAYQPLTYYFFGLIYMVVNLLAGSGFQGWLAMGNNAVEIDHLLRYLFLMKLPLVIAFSLTGFYLSKLFNDSRKKNLSLLLWFFNPISIYVVAMIGQFDIIPVLLTVMALYFAKKKPVVASILLGLGAAMKGFPLFLIPFLIILMEGSIVKRAKTFIVGISTYVFFILPFITKRAFIESAAVSGLTQRMFIPGVSFGFDEKFLIIPALYLVLIYVAINNDLGKVKNLYKYFFSGMFLISAAVHFHAQWALWFLPFLLVLLVKRDNLKKPLFGLASVILVLSYFATFFLLKDRFLTVGLLSVFDPAVFFLPSPFEVVGKFYDPFILQSIFHSFYLVSGGVLITRMLNEKNSK